MTGLRATAGFVIQPMGWSEEQMQAEAQEVNAALHVVLDDPKPITALQASGATVIFRLAEDDHAHEKWDAEQFVERLHRIAPLGAWLHLGNEPGKASLPKLSTWSLAALKACHARGRTGVAFNHATGEPEPYQWAEMAAPIDYAYETGQYVGVHEYYDRTIAKGIADWHINRFRFLREFAGRRCPDIVLTEYGCAPGYNPHMGWATSLTPEQNGIEIERGMVEVYQPAGVATCGFILGPWDRSTTYDMRGQAPIRAYMKAANARAETNEGDNDMAGPPGWVQVKTGPSGVNVRSGAGIAAPVVAVIKTDAWVRRDGEAIKNGAYTWQPVRLENCTRGHVALEVIDIG